MKYFWKMRNGQQIDVDEMSETHLRNALKMMIRNNQIKATRKKPIGNIEANFFEAQNNEFIDDEMHHIFYN